MGMGRRISQRTDVHFLAQEDVVSGDASTCAMTQTRRGKQQAGKPNVTATEAFRNNIHQTRPVKTETLAWSATQSQNHRMFGIGRDLYGSSIQPSCRSRVTYSRLHRTLSRRVLNISREGDSTTSLSSLFQCSVTLRGKKFFLISSWNFLCFSLCPLPLVLSLGTTEKSLAPSSRHPPLRYL